MANYIFFYKSYIEISISKIEVFLKWWWILPIILDPGWLILKNSLLWILAWRSEEMLC